MPNAELRGRETKAETLCNGLKCWHKKSFHKSPGLSRSLSSDRLCKQLLNWLATANTNIIFRSVFCTAVGTFLYFLHVRTDDTALIAKWWWNLFPHWLQCHSLALIHNIIHIISHKPPVTIERTRWRRWFGVCALIRTFFSQYEQYPEVSWNPIQFLLHLT